MDYLFECSDAYIQLMEDTSAFQRDILWTIALFEGCDRRPEGSRLQEVLEAFYPNEVYNARFYPNLDTLHERGYIQKCRADGRTNEYPLTETGREQLFIRGQMVTEVLRLNGYLTYECNK